MTRGREGAATCRMRGPELKSGDRDDAGARAVVDDLLASPQERPHGPERQKRRRVPDAVHRSFPCRGTGRAAQRAFYLLRGVYLVGSERAPQMKAPSSPGQTAYVGSMMTFRASGLGAGHLEGEWSS